ncbi:MAG: hypothetical protein D6732_24625 [Methanobacteriota archaeon]|nr:MAG: hypothetical protein D6732_24625 [Euryarchaeota archaeon]
MQAILQNIRKNLENSPQVFNESFAHDLRIAEAIINNPVAYPPKLIRDLNEEEIMNRLRQSKLSKPVYRKYWIRLSQDLSDRILNLSEDKEWVLKSKKKLFDLGKTDLTAKIFWLTLINQIKKHRDKLEIETDFIESLRLLAPKVRVSHFRDVIRDYISSIYGSDIVERKTTEDIQSLLQYLEVILNEDLNSEKIEEIEFALAETYENLSSVYQTLLWEIEEARDSSIRSFLTDMNSQKNGYLLDHVLTSLKHKDPDLNEKFVKLFASFLKLHQINPIFPMGRTTIKKDQFDFIEIVGESFEDANDVVVDIISPGWRYKNYVISKARGVEVK